MTGLKELREKIDEVDNNILRLLADRVKVCAVIGSAKKMQGLPVKDDIREEEVFSHIRSQAMKFGLDALQVEAVYREIVNMCSSVQE